MTQSGELDLLRILGLQKGEETKGEMRGIQEILGETGCSGKLGAMNGRKNISLVRV